MKELRRIRRAKDITQEELGQRVGLSAAAISAFERGEANPKQDTLIGLADALDVAVDELLGRLPKAEAPSASREVGAKPPETIVDVPSLKLHANLVEARASLKRALQLIDAGQFEAAAKEAEKAHKILDEAA